MFTNKAAVRPWLRVFTFLAVFLCGLLLPKYFPAVHAVNCAPGYCGPNPANPRVDIDVFDTCYNDEVSGNCTVQGAHRLSWSCNPATCSGVSTSSPKQHCEHNNCTYTLHYDCCVAPSGKTCIAGNSDCIGKQPGDSCGSGGTCQDNNGDGYCACGGEPEPTPPPSPTPPPNNPIGFLDTFMCSYNGSTATWYFQGFGWAGDYDDPNTPLRINFYVDDPGASDPSKMLGYVAAANTARCDAQFICDILGGANCSACAACTNGGPQCGHRSDLINLTGINSLVRATLTNGAAHSITARAINIGSSGSDTQLVGTVTTTCPQLDCKVNSLPDNLVVTTGGPAVPVRTFVSDNVAPVSYVSFNKMPPNATFGSFSPVADSTLSNGGYDTTFTPAAVGSGGMMTVALLTNNQFCSDFTPVNVQNAAGGFPTCTAFSAPNSAGQGSTITLTCSGTSGTGATLTNIEFFYTLASNNKNYCSTPYGTTGSENPANYWVPIPLSGPPTIPPPSYNTGSATANFNVGTTPIGQYYFIARLTNSLGRVCSGNPGACSGGSLRPCINCSKVVEITSCTPSCPALQCNQDNGCSGSCGGNDALPPPDPVWNNPAVPPAQLNMNGTTNVAIDWQDDITGITDQWHVKIYDANITDPPQNVPCGTGPGKALCVPRSVSNYTYNPSTSNGQYIGNNIKIAIRGLNNSCVGVAGNPPNNATCDFNGTVNGVCGNWVTTTTSLTDNITGKIYLDGNADATNNILTHQCFDDEARVPQNVTGTISLNGTSVGPLNGNQFTINDVPYWPQNWGAPTAPNQVTLSLDSTLGNTVICTCPGGCSQTEISAPDESPPGDVEYFVNIYDLSQLAWWQTVGGLVYGSSSYSSSIPSTSECTSPICAPYLSQQVSVGGTAIDYSGGIPMTSGGSLTVGEGFLNNRAPGLLHPYARNVYFGGATREDYAFFAQNFNLSTVNQIAGGSTITSIPAGSVLPNDPTTYVYYVPGNLTVAPTSTINIPANQKYVIFVSGTLTFQNPSGTLDQLINVPSSSFLGFIAAQDMTFNQDVGDTDVTGSTPAVAGMYVTDGMLTIAANTDTTSDRKFIGKGTFVGWAGVTMQRTYADAGLGAQNNLTYPAETFIHMPELVLNFPDALRRPSVTWQETN